MDTPEVAKRAATYSELSVALGQEKKNRVFCTLLFFSVGKKTTITGAHNKGHTTFRLCWCRDVFTNCATFRLGSDSPGVLLGG